MIEIYTIGHGNRKIESFINLLNQYQIKLLVDVRSIPFSRFHSQFRQSNLIASLAEAEIKYLFLGKGLGGRPADQALYINGIVNYEAIKETETFKAGINEIISIVKQGIKVTLMCSESDQNDCHRKHLIADELTKLGISVLHINKVGLIERHICIDDYKLFS